MAETIEKITRTDPEPKKKFRDDPDVQIQKLRFWARLILILWGISQNMLVVNGGAGRAPWGGEGATAPSPDLSC